MMLPLGTGRKQLQFSYVLHVDATWHTCTIAEFCGKPHSGAKRHHIFFRQSDAILDQITFTGVAFWGRYKSHYNFNPKLVEFYC